ncbi:hypothetical protein McaMca56_004720 [Microsporum canis]
MGTDIPRYLVDRRDIPLEHQKLYDAAAESRLYSVNSLSHHPKDLEPEFIVTKPLEDQFIAKVEQSYFLEMLLLEEYRLKNAVVMTFLGYAYLMSQKVGK